MNKISKICTCLLALLLVCSSVLTAQAAGSVTYNGYADKFIFKPGTKHSPTSLFENFQNVMPGDTLTEQIFIKNDTSNKVKIKVYMRSLGAQENTDDFLSQMNLTVQQKDESILFAAPADETAQLTDWVYLGTVYSGGEITLDVTLEVPITMGNDYQNKVGYIDWEFKVEELPIEPTDPQPPQTGDTSNIFLYSGLMIFSLVGLIVLLATKRRKQEENI
jgi:LPXTG-motif cell wall-anchored protein